MVVVSTVLLIVSAAAAGIFFMAPGDDNAVASFIHRQPGSVRWDEHTAATTLLIGSSGPGRPATSLTVVSVDPNHRSLHVLSIPPNLWVTIPGFGQGRIVDAYADGGPSLAVMTVQSMTHVAIPYYVVARTGPFRSLVDTLGGVTLRVPAALRAPHYPAANGSGTVNILIRRGLQHLNGASALDYIRVSTPASGGLDGAMARQQRLLIGLIEDAVSQRNFFRIPALITSLGGTFPTNFPYDQVPALAHVVTRLSQSRVIGARLDSSNQTVTRYAVNNANVLIPDWYHIRLIAARLFPERALLARPGIVVLNASDVVGQAASLSSWLSLGGIHVARYATAQRTMARTVVEVPPAASTSQQRMAASLAVLLQAPVVENRKGTSVTVVIGRNYQDLNEQ